jgi:hypothetical protein
MDLKTGEVTQGNTPTAGGHAAGGPHRTVGPYSQLMKILVRNGSGPQTEAAADDVRIFANYKEPVSTDYGHVSANGKWVVTDGTTGDVAGQHLMISVDDPAAVLRVCHHNTSRNDWSTNTYSSSSPDVTKVAWVSDQFDDGDVYVAITGRPAPPTDLKAERAADGVKLTWKAPENTKEIGGYRIYRSEKSGFRFVALNAEPIRDMAFIDKDKAPATEPRFYLVAMVEPSGVEGTFSNEAMVPSEVIDDLRAIPRTLFFEAENLQWKPPMRLVLGGDASGSRYLRVHRASASEPAEGVVSAQADVPAGTYALWLRVRAEDKPGSWIRSQAAARDRLALDPNMVSPEAGPTFTWVKMPGPIVAEHKKPVPIVLGSATDGLALDRIALTKDTHFDRKLDDSETVPPQAVAGLAVAEVTPQSIRLKWNANAEKNIARYDVHVARRFEKPKFGNGTIIGSTKDTQFLDWGLTPGMTYVYYVFAVDTRGNQSGITMLDATTAAQTIQQVKATLAAGEGMVKAAPKITYTVDVKEEAPFMAWVRYSPAYVPVKQHRVAVEIDGKPAGAWQLRAPYRPMSWVLTSKGKAAERIFVDKIVADGKDVFTLAPGKHTIALSCEAAPPEEQNAFGGIVLTNDHSFRPEGYDPRANFHKRN